MQIWCAATASSLMRDAIAVAVSNATINDAVRTTSRLPTVALARTPAGRGRSDASARRPSRATITRYAIAAPYCASTVPHAEPAMPRSSVYTKSSSTRRLAALASTAITSVVFVSCMPRR